MFLVRVLFLLALAAPSLAVHGVGVERWLTGDPDDATVRPEGGLLLQGGGGDVDPAMRWLMEKARGGDAVVLRASGADGYNDYLFRELGVALDSVETLRFSSPESAHDADAVQAIEQAEVLFIAGGDQSHYVARWRESPVLAAINRHLRAGKPAGGTSAGLAVLGEFCYSAMHTGDLTSELALRSPDHPFITLERGFLDAPLLRTMFTDSHFSQREREGRLVVMLHRAREAWPDAAVFGLGVDERAAVCVEPDGTCRVISPDGTGATVVRLLGKDALTQGTAELVRLDTSSRLRLPGGAVDAPASVRQARVEAGRLIFSSHP